MIPSYTTVNTLKSNLSNISIRFIMQMFQINAFFKSNLELYENSSKRIFIKFKIEHDRHISMSFIIFDKYYKEIIYNSSILVSSMKSSTYEKRALKGRFIFHFIKYIKNAIDYNIKSKCDNFEFNNLVSGEVELRNILYSLKLSINNVNILTSGNPRLIEIENPLENESYIIYHKK